MDIPTHLDIGHVSAHRVLHDVLQYHNVSARYVPRHITPELKQRRIDTCQEILRSFEEYGDGFISINVTGHQTGFHDYEHRVPAMKGFITPHRNRRRFAHSHIQER